MDGGFEMRKRRQIGLKIGFWGWLCMPLNGFKVFITFINNTNKELLIEELID